MSETQQLPIFIQPVISYPREAQVGKTYLVTIDLQQPDGSDEWPYEDEEYPIYCMLDTSPLFSSKPVGEPALVLHRFGGSYGAAKFLLTAAREPIDGKIQIMLVNSLGVPIKAISLPNVRVTREVNRAPLAIGECEVEVPQSIQIETLEESQKSPQIEDNQRDAKLQEATVTRARDTSGIAHPSNIHSDQVNREESLKILPDIPCLNLAISRLYTTGEGNFAIWVLKAPYPGGYTHHDCRWPQTLSQTWQAWQSMFATDRLHQGLPDLVPQPLLKLPTDAVTSPYTSRLMQHLGVSLWQWVFRGSIQNTLAQSQGIALGQDKPLRLRLDIRDPDLIVLPWEIMQPQSGKPAISIYQPILFSRTTSDVDPLPPRQTSQSLNILLVLGQNGADANNRLHLEQEAATLAQTLKGGEKLGADSNAPSKAKCSVHTLLQPTPEELISQLETGAYNIFFYVGHGLSGPDGGLLFLGPDMTLNGTELAQVLTRCQVTLCVINACWGVQPATSNQQTLPRSSLAEVLIQHGVPAVLGMRDEIADREALTFIQAFVQALTARLPIDQAVAVARQQLLTVYRFNYPAWTLPVLYLHPEFDGELILMQHEGIAELPENTPSSIGKSQPTATLRALSPETQVWSLGADVVRLGRTAENDIVISEVWVSLRHAEIFRHDASRDGTPVPTYFLRDNSRNGTLFLGTDGWQKVHREEVPLQPGMQLKFGSVQGQIFEFLVEG